MAVMGKLEPNLSYAKGRAILRLCKNDEKGIITQAI